MTEMKSTALRVLIVDDYALLRNEIRQMLGKDEELEVVGEAGDGQAAIAAATELRPDLIIMDVAMPELSGIEAARRIVAAQPDVKIVALSQYDDKRLVADMLRAGARAYVLKDEVYDDLRPAVEAVAAGRTYLGKGVPTS